MKTNRTKPVCTSMSDIGSWKLNVALGLLLFSCASALAGVHYVDVNSTNATPPYTNWTTAATNIQDAVDAAVAGDEIVVTNGVYATGGRTTSLYQNNRVLVDKAVTLRSVNGPQFTIIDGGGGSRCVYLTNFATLSGFTVRNGSAEKEGGGVYCESVTAVVSNCVITGNRISTYLIEILGGGAYGGTLNNCTLTRNRVGRDNLYLAINRVDYPAKGGGAAYCVLNNCVLSDNAADLGVVGDYSWYAGVTAQGGGAYLCTLNNCTLSGNSACATLFTALSAAHNSVVAEGGGAYLCTLNNCTLSGNSASSDPGYDLFDDSDYSGAVGCAVYCTLNNCTLTGNSATNSAMYYDFSSGGAYACTLNNCISFGNTDEGCCEDCDSPGYGVGNNNYFGDALFVDTNGWANLRLQSNSPCINGGANAYVIGTTDLDGNPRIAGGTVDIGAYEFQSPVSMISYAWLQQFNLPINPAADTADPDGDGVDNYHEWLAGTNPTNRLSSPAQLTIIPSGTSVILTWSTNAVGFTLQSTTNLLSSAAWVTNSPPPVVIAGQNTVTNPITEAQQFFRLVQ